MHFRRQPAALRFGTALTLAALCAALVATPAAAAVNLEVVAGGFTRPLYVTHAGDDRLFVVEQGGLIKIINANGSVRSAPFLDVSARITDAGNEQGLLGLAFHPDYATNGLFYINYTRKRDGATVIAEYRRSAADANLADPPEVYARRVLRIDQPFANHNGGWMAFKGNLLYIAVGDGGGDPKNRAQNLKKLLGKILRINPLDPDGNGSRRYSNPQDNPFVGRPGRNEIWAYGLRNPWRCSHDRVEGRLWCADVGQNQYEEVNRTKTGKGLNFGWPVMEGRHCYNPPSGCDTSGKTLPIAEYAHSAFGGGNCSVTGGYVARRSGAALAGMYVFGDFCSGNIWVIDDDHPAGAALPTPTDTPRLISSFGEGNDGRLYLTDLSNGTVYYVSGT